MLGYRTKVLITAAFLLTPLCACGDKGEAVAAPRQEAERDAAKPAGERLGGPVAGGNRIALRIDPTAVGAVEKITIGDNPLLMMEKGADGVIAGVVPPGNPGKAAILLHRKEGATPYPVPYRYDMGLPASGIMVDVTWKDLPLDHDYGMDSAVGDMDNDGDLDIFVPSHEKQNRLYLNDGKGRFTDTSASNLPQELGETCSEAEPADLDGDGYLDIYISAEGQDKLLINRGKDAPGVFYAMPVPEEKGATQDAVVGDIDGDGDLDIITANLGITADIGEQNLLLINDGGGNFEDETAKRLPPVNDRSYQVLLIDVDGDRDLDLYVVNNGGQNRLYTNDGKGFFAEVTEKSLPKDGDLNTAAAAGDVDGDGDIDIITVDTGNPGPNRLLLNDGKGIFSVSEGKLPGDGERTDYDAKLADIDGDDDLDLALSSMGAPSRLYKNDGKGNFTSFAGGNLTDERFYTFSVNFGDFNGDGKIDLFLSNLGDKQDFLYFNDVSEEGGTLAVRNVVPNFGAIDGGTPIEVTGRRFTEKTVVTVGGQPLLDARLELPTRISGRTPPGAVGIAAVAARDGTATAEYLQAFSYEKVAAGSLFKDVSTMLPSFTDNTEDVHFGDLDGDGDFDIFVCNMDAPHRLYLFDAKRKKFIDAPDRLPPTNTAKNNTGFECVLVDVDLDKDLDVVIGNDGFNRKGNRNRIYINDGKGFFADETDARLPKAIDHTNGVVAADFNGDGYPDLAVANGGKENAQNRLYVNKGKDGAGIFVDVTATHLPADNDDTGFVAAGDVDGDGDIDLYWGGNGGKRNLLYINDGKGRFADETEGRVPNDAVAGQKGNDTMDAKIVDLDKDGDNDIVIARPYAHKALFYRNDGKGRFTDVEGFPEPENPKTQLHGSTDILPFDVDGDGDLDLIFTFWVVAPTTRLLINDGKGNFSVNYNLVPITGQEIGNGDVADIDGDGDLDVILGRYKRNILLENLSKKK
ncbi:MAG: hypothetical protein A2Z34_08560 [Planctomycetes bacterium RBG_16_59_8]|nr:MAG: hypothetical protein A2Z34_08560 [Planctomycetes bacterium RBG_16_59_8]